jgi:hypothetical protein
MIALSPVAHADCSNPTDPDFGDCSFPPTTAAPKTPKPSPQPSTTPKATKLPAATTRPAQRTSSPVIPRTSTRETPFVIGDVEVPTENPLATPEIVVDGPLDESQNFEVAEPTAGVSSWIFGFIFGFLVGALVGRASWGIRRRRRQQIFG